MARDGCDIFIGYVGQVPYVDALRRHLHNELGKRYRVFSDCVIPGGSKWSSVVDRALFQCEVAVMLLPAEGFDQDALFGSYFVDEWIVLASRVRATRLLVPPYLHRLFVITNMTALEIAKLEKRETRLARAGALELQLTKHPSLATDQGAIAAEIIRDVDSAMALSAKRLPKPLLRRLDWWLAEITALRTTSGGLDGIEPIALLHASPREALDRQGKLGDAAQRTLARLLAIAPAEQAGEDQVSPDLVARRLRAARRPRGETRPWPTVAAGSVVGAAVLGAAALVAVAAVLLLSGPPKAAANESGAGVSPPDADVGDVADAGPAPDAPLHDAASLGDPRIGDLENAIYDLRIAVARIDDNIRALPTGRARSELQQSGPEAEIDRRLARVVDTLQRGRDAGTR